MYYIDSLSDRSLRNCPKPESVYVMFTDRFYFGYPTVTVMVARLHKIPRLNLNISWYSVSNYNVKFSHNKSSNFNVVSAEIELNTFTITHLQLI